VQTRTNEFNVFPKKIKEVRLTYSKQISFSNNPTPKTTLRLHIDSCTTMEEVLDHPWYF
jgi:hypothetical protein